MIASLKFEPLRIYKVVPIDGASKRIEIGFSLVGTTELTAGRITNPTDLQDQVLRELHDLLNMELSERMIEENEPSSKSGNGPGLHQEAGPAVGGPDRQDDEGQSGGQGPVQRVDTAPLADKDPGPSGGVPWPG